MIEFLIVAFAVFLLVTRLNRFKAAPATLEETRACPFCVSQVPIKATRCPFCTSELRGVGA